MRASFDETPKEYKWRRRKKTIGCIFCPPHGGENRTRSYKYPIKKQYQLDPKRRHKLP